MNKIGLIWCSAVLLRIGGMNNGWNPMPDNWSSLLEVVLFLLGPLCHLNAVVVEYFAQVQAAFLLTPFGWITQVRGMKISWMLHGRDREVILAIGSYADSRDWLGMAYREQTKEEHHGPLDHIDQRWRSHDEGYQEACTWEQPGPSDLDAPDPTTIAIRRRTMFKRWENGGKAGRRFPCTAHRATVVFV